MFEGANSIYVFFAIELVFLILFVKNSSFISKKAAKYYCIAVLINIISYIAYIFRYIFEQNKIIFPAKIDEVIIYGCSPLIAYFLLFYTCRKSKKMIKYITISQAIYSILCILLSFTNLLFSIDENGVYSRGPLSFIPFTYTGIMLVFWIVYLMSEYKTLAFKDKFIILSFAIIEIVSIGIQFVNSTYKFSIIGSSFLLFIYYIFLIEIEGKYDNQTKVYNRRYYSIATSNLVNNYTVIVFDINNLKNTNDTLGHDRGDILITEIAKTIKEKLKCDNVYRIGGDEFVAVLNELNANNVRHFIKEINDELVTKSSSFGFELSVSSGYAVNTNGNDFTNVFRIADSNMYKNKSEYYKITGKQRRQ